MEAILTLNQSKNSFVPRKIILADIAGVCFGVRRALKMAEEVRKERDGKITTLGPIVHNEQVISRMESQGIGTSANLEEIQEGTVILSAHGVSPKILERAKSQQLQIVDVTCPFVTKVHRTAKKLYQEGYQILLIGDPDHTEVKGIIGTIESIGGSVTLVSDVKEVPNLKLSKKVGIVSQTTQRNENYAEIVGAISKIADEVRAINTICGATDELQDAAVKMAREVEVAIVIGGKKSANTRRLRDICEEQGIPAYHIETADEIQEAWLEGKINIGITAGASTPDWMIEDIASTINGGKLPEDWQLHHPDE